MEFERKTGIIGFVGIILIIFNAILSITGVELPIFVFRGINIVGGIFITIFIFESFIVFFKNTDKYK